MSPLRLDPRTKLLVVCTGSVIVLLVHTCGLLALLAGAAIYLTLLGMPRQAIWGVMIFAALMLTQYGLSLVMAGPMLMFGFMLFFIAQITPVMMLGQALVSTPPGELVTALHRLRTPRPLVLACAVALRFFPTVGEELRTIRDGMRLRGLSPLSWRAVTRPVMTIESLYVPLMMRSMKVADDLAVSAASRGADNPGPRTSLRELRFTIADAGATACTALGLAAAVYFRQAW